MLKGAEVCIVLQILSQPLELQCGALVSMADPGLSVRGGGGGGGGGGGWGVLSNGYKMGWVRVGATPSPTPVWGSAVSSPIGVWGSPQKLFKCRIIKLQKDKNFSYFFLRTKLKHEQWKQIAHAHTHFYFVNLNEKQNVIEKIRKCV